MRQTSLLLTALGSLVPFVLGHGQVHRIITETATYIADDAYSTVVNPNSPLRKLNSVGPAAPFTGPDIVCGPGGNTPVQAVAPVRAGSKVTFDWNSWGSDHKGPVMTYVARCPNGCSTFKGDKGNIWVKIDHAGYDGPTNTWAEQKLHSPGTWTVTIPASLADGEYILRHEVLGLHVAGQLNGAQFYPNCIQIKVTGGGSANPTGIALPGAYQPNDPGILVELWRITPSNPSYQIPGGPVVLSGGSGTPPPASTPRPSGTTAKPTTSTAGPAQTAYGQCGGQGWTGLTTCISGYKCNAQSQYYSQCIPA